MKKLLTLLLAILILAAGVGTAVFFVKTRPRAEKKRPPRMTPIVECAAITAGVHQIKLDLMGTVIAAHEVNLKAQVAGRIEETHPEWVEGGQVKVGEVIVRLEDDDYRIRVDQAEIDLALAQSELALEMGRQDIARREWAMLGQEGSDLDRELALRKPQLKSALARVKSASNRVEQAHLDLSRTVIRAPFDALVMSREMNTGDLATTLTSLGRLAATDRYHAQVSIPVDQLKWVQLPGRDDRGGSEARVELADGSSRSGRVIRLLGDLEPQGRMARLLVMIDEPLAGSSPVLLGSYVHVIVSGSVVEDCYEISRDHYREGGEIWLLTSDKTLRILRIDPVFSARDQLIFKADIASGERLITTDLSAPIEGMSLRVVGDPDTAPGRERPEEQPGKGKQGGREAR